MKDTYIKKMTALYRKGWIHRNVVGKESDASHSIGLCFLLTSLKQYVDFNYEKAIKMALIHDVVEVISKDLTPYDEVCPNEKYNKELDAAEKMFSIDELKLWKEFEARKNIEGSLVKDADRLDMIIQGYVFEQLDGEKYIDYMIEWIEVNNNIKNEFFISWYEELKNIRDGLDVKDTAANKIVRNLIDIYKNYKCNYDNKETLADKLYLKSMKKIDTSEFDKILEEDYAV
ncbi:MAG: HD domain-containing protein [Clostridia bacterium]|jgi:putative hydrolase of HD superfamily|nr:HD domain-containing protein [Clostridia bacterium]